MPNHVVNNKYAYIIYVDNNFVNNKMRKIIIHRIEREKKNANNRIIIIIMVIQDDRKCRHRPLCLCIILYTCNRYLNIHTDTTRFIEEIREGEKRHFVAKQRGKAERERHSLFQRQHTYTHTHSRSGSFSLAILLFIITLRYVSHNNHECKDNRIVEF